MEEARRAPPLAAVLRIPFARGLDLFIRHTGLVVNASAQRVMPPAESRLPRIGLAPMTASEPKRPFRAFRFDPDQIQGNRARTMICLRTRGSTRNAQEGAVQLTPYC